MYRTIVRMSHSVVCVTYMITNEQLKTKMEKDLWFVNFCIFCFSSYNIYLLSCFLFLWYMYMNLYYIFQSKCYHTCDTGIQVWRLFALDDLCLLFWYLVLFCIPLKKVCFINEPLKGFYKCRPANVVLMMNMTKPSIMTEK